jgi:hypothetical protein
LKFPTVLIFQLLNYSISQLLNPSEDGAANRKIKKAAISGRLFFELLVAKWFMHPSRSRPASPWGL